jgi:hypothetical protein
MDWGDKVPLFKERVMSRQGYRIAKLKTMVMVRNAITGTLLTVERSSFSSSTHRMAIAPDREKVA